VKEIGDTYKIIVAVFNFGRIKRRLQDKIKMYFKEIVRRVSRKFI
jgi:hypothetical protein